MEITSGYTKEFSASLPQWYRQEDTADQIQGWDELMEQKDTYALLRRLQPVPFYRYILRYLIAAHCADLKRAAKSGGIDPNKRDWENAYAQAVFQEIEENPKRKPLLKAVAQLVMNDFAANGCSPEDKSDAVYGSLTEDTLWNLDAVRKTLSARTIQDSKFFALALGLNMSLEDTELFLQKVLLRGALDLRLPEEMLLYLTLKHIPTGKREFYRSALEKFRTVKAKKPRETAPTGTIYYQSMAQTAVSTIEAKHITFDGKSQEFLTFLAEYKALQAEEVQRSATRRFLSLVSRFKSLCAAEIADQSTAKFAEVEQAEGQLHITFQPGTDLRIPKGTVFTGKAKGKPYECTATETVEAKLPPLAQVVIPVAYRGQGSGTVAAHTTFTCALEALQGIENHSKLKPNKATSKVTGKLFARCAWGAHIPAGTVFTANGEEYVSTEAVPVMPYALVPVQSVRENEDIPRDTITQPQTPFPTAENITAITHGKMTCHREDAIGEKKQKGQTAPEQDICPDYRLCGYLYAPAEGRNFFQSHSKDRSAAALLGLQEETGHSARDLAQALGQILEGTALTPTRFTLLRKQAGTTVKRHEVLTLAFLIEMYRAEFRWEKADPEAEESWSESCWELISGVLQRVNEALRDCAFHEVYLPNPYDCLLVYLFTCCEPLSAFRNLWGIYLDEKNTTVNTGVNQ